MKRLRSTETLGSTSAINSDKTGTLTLNQMTAVELAIAGRRYAITGSGYSTEGQIKRVAGDADVPLEPVPAADGARLRRRADQDGELIGDPTEGALVVLAEKGGLDAVATREAYPRVAELPFDAAYKLMATFHRMKDEDGQRRRPLLRQGRARPAARPQLVRASTRSCSPVAVDDDFARALPGRERAARRAGPARAGDGAQGLRPGDVRSRRPTCCR